MRIYAAITSINPLRIYLFEEGLVRFASEIYVPPADSQNNRFVHLTNYSINKTNKNGIKASKVHDDDDEEKSDSKWSLKLLKKVLRAHGVNDSKLFNKIKDIIIKTIISCEPILN